MKIAVVGAGAMGSILEHQFRARGTTPCSCGCRRPTHRDDQRRKSVTVVHGEEKQAPRPATTDAGRLSSRSTFVIYFTKSFHTAGAAETARPLVGPETVVASLQNGWGNGDVLAGVYPEEQVVVGVTYNSGLVQGPGRVVHPADQPTIVGSFAEGQTDDAGPARLAQALTDGGLEASVVSPVRPEIWKKLILNAATLPTAALTGMNAGALTAHAPVHDLVSETAREAVAVARGLGYEIDAEELWHDPRAPRKAGPSKASMFQDPEAGRQTEVDVINGAVVKAADEPGVHAPFNRALARMVKGWEAARGLG